MDAETRTRLIEKRKTQFQKQQRKLKDKMTHIKHKIAIISGKGGVGKSTVAANLAVALATHGHANQIGLLDADIHGPSIPKILGLADQRLQITPQGIFPVLGPLGIKVVSMDFLLPDVEAPVIWRGPLKMTAIRQFLSDVLWGSLDILVIDLPPGTGDEPLSIAQLLPDIDGVVIVTIPSEVSQVVVKKAVTFARTLGMPVIGVVENMSGFICPHCGSKTDIFQSGGGQKVANELGLPFLGSMPIDSKISEDSDKGFPFIVADTGSASTHAFMEITKKIEDYLRKRETTSQKQDLKEDGA